MSPKQRIFITIGIGAVLLLSFYFITGAITKYTGYSVSDDERHTDFENCLREQDIVLYINSKDAMETLESIEVQDHLDDIKIFNCLRNNEYCVERDIDSFPTWTINGKVINRDINVFELADFSGCKLN